MLDGYSEAEQDRLYNRCAEHAEGEHVTSWNGCPACESDWMLVEAVYGLMS